MTSSVGNIINRNIYTSDVIQERSKSFKENGYVELPMIFNEHALDLINCEIDFLYTLKKEKNFTMPGYCTPRKMSVIGGKEIKKNSNIITAIYESVDVSDFISKITNSEIFTIDHEEECIVINILEKDENTHGWHLDDPKYALVFILNAPTEENGGNLEVVKDWKSFCRNKKLDSIMDCNKALAFAKDLNSIKSIHHDPGSCYLLNASECLHRVTPIKKDALRVAMNFAYHNNKSVYYGETANFLYGNF